MKNIYILIILLFAGFHSSFAQNEVIVKGTIKDAQKEALIGVNIAVKDKLIGTSTDAQGNFELRTKTPLPFTIIISSLGFEEQEIEVTQATTQLNLELKESSILGREVVIAASRYEESSLESPVSIEKLGILDIRETTAPNFYDALRNLKGVDMGTQSLLFTTPNTRGFNDNTNYRVSQYIDGVDNSSPGLNFPAGNMVGASQLDVESVELLVGASSALYGPGGVNGTILMTTKNPFEYQGLSASMQTGVMHVGADYRDNPALMTDFNARYAKAFNDRFAFKVNVSYIQATDWHATDERDNNNLDFGPTSHSSNPGYDGVNVYGDENIAGVDLSDDNIKIPTANGIALGQGFTPGTPEYDAAVQSFIALFPEEQTIITRTGYREADLVDYDTYSFKANASLHYRLNENLELIGQGGYGQGTSVYTASSRFTLRNFALYSAKLELKGNKFFVRAWMVGENAGSTYDIGTSAIQINESWKPSAQWYEEFIGAYTTARLFGNPQGASLLAARGTADQGRWLPGSPQFENAFEQIRTQPVTNEFSESQSQNLVRGTQVIDKSKMYNIEGMYDLSDFFKFADILVGFSHRIISINSEGTIFGDPIGEPHSINQTGAYVQIAKSLLNNKLKFTGTGRYDKNSNFEGRFTPRASLVYTVDPARKHNIRGSVQTAFRFPSIADQYTNLNVGVFRVIGGLPQFRNPYNFEEDPVYPLDSPNPITGQPDPSQGEFTFPEFRPERVVAWEIGYKGLINKNVLIDVYGYYNTYSGFVANQAFGRGSGEDTQKFLSAISLDEEVSAYGWAFSLDYEAPKGYIFSANVAYNKLDEGGVSQGIQTRFNSSDYRTNISLSNRNVAKNIGFSVSWHWQNDFIWQSTFGVGEVPAYNTLDAQVSYKIEKLKTIVKLGGANLLNNYYTTGFGNPQIGGLYYISLSFDEFLN